MRNAQIVRNLRENPHAGNLCGILNRLREIRPKMSIIVEGQGDLPKAAA